MKSILLLVFFLGISLAKNLNCALYVPQNPLSAIGLATPYRLTTLDPSQGHCNQSDPDQAAFVQSTILNKDTGELYVYNPLVVNDGSAPAVAPTFPQLPNNYVIGIWFGTFAQTLTLLSTDGSLIAGNCVDGSEGSPFGQFAYCNAVEFFSATNTAIAAGKISIPDLNTANDGGLCPTTRDFFTVNRVPPVTYVVSQSGQMAQYTAATSGIGPILGSDGLYKVMLDFVMECSTWTVPDLANPGNDVPSLALNEIQAAAKQQKPIALVTAGEATINGNANLNKLNAFRLGLGQETVASLDQAPDFEYCQQLSKVFPIRLEQSKQLLQQSPFAYLYDMMSAKYSFTFSSEGLNCTEILNNPPTNSTSSTSTSTSESASSGSSTSGSSSTGSATSSTSGDMASTTAGDGGAVETEPTKSPWIDTKLAITSAVILGIVFGGAAIAALLTFIVFKLKAATRR